MMKTKPTKQICCSKGRWKLEKGAKSKN